MPKDHAETDMQALSRQMDTLRGDVAELTRIVGDAGRRRREAAGDEMTRRAQDLRSTAEAKGAQAREQAEALQDGLARQMRDQPATTAAIVAGAGFLAGFLSARR